jgi:hypothetical protein
MHTILDSFPEFAQFRYELVPEVILGGQRYMVIDESGTARKCAVCGNYFAQTGYTILQVSAVPGKARKRVPVCGSCCAGYEEKDAGHNNVSR